MKLIENFYKIIKFSVENENINIFYVELNYEHEIYKAHFPDNPITPGVCLIAIVKEILSIYILKNQNIKLEHIKNVKFLNPINPLIDKNLVYKIEYKKNDNETIAKIEILNKNLNLTFAKIKLIVSENRLNID